MIGLLAAVAGYLLGGVPTADWLARRAGIDLARGSGNPGANNALRLGGRRLAASVLLVEVIKGAACVAVGAVVGGDEGMAFAGVGAALGNVLNPYRSLRGGQGLGIAAGVLLAALPAAAVTGIVSIALLARILHRTAPATLAALGTVVLTGIWAPAAPWGVESRGWATVLAIGLATVLAPKQIARLRRYGRPPSPRPA